MATFTVSRTASTSPRITLDRRGFTQTASQPRSRQPRPTSRPSFLLVLLRALGAMAS